MTTRRTFLLSICALAVGPALPKVEPLMFRGVPLVFDEPTVVGGIDRAMNQWWWGLPHADQAIPVDSEIMALFDQCLRGVTDDDPNDRPT